MCCLYGKNEERRQRKFLIVFNSLLQQKRQKYADHVQETVQNIFRQHYPNVFHTHDDPHIFVYKYSVYMCNNTE